MLKLIINATAFNLCWFGLVLAGNAAVPWALAWVALHIMLQPDSWQEMRFVLTVSVIGIITDATLTGLGVLIFSEQSMLLPLWMVALWLGFATTVNHSLAVLRRSRVLRVLVAIAGAPSSYLLGSRLGQVELGQDILATYGIFSITWVVLLEVFARIPSPPGGQVSHPGSSSNCSHQRNMQPEKPVQR